MAYLIAILVFAVLFAGFILLTAIERKSGKRVLNGMRTALDTRVAKLAFILKHVDFVGFVVHIFRIVFGHIAHDIASMTLRAVRSFDRFLSTLVHRLRKPRDERVSLQSGSKFVKTMSYFKENLQNPHAPKAEETPTPTVVVE